MTCISSLKLDQSSLKYNLNCHKIQKMSASNAKAPSSIVRGLTTAASSAIAAVVGYTAITTTLNDLASVNSSAAGSTFTATQGYLRVVGAGTMKASAGTVASSAVVKAQRSVKDAAAGSALASAGTVASSAVTASQGSASTVDAAGSVSAGTFATSALTASDGSAAVEFSSSILTSARVAIISACATAQDSASAVTVAASAGAATTTAVAAAKADNTGTVAAGNDLASAGTMAGSAICGTPAYIAATKHQPSAGNASTSAFLQSAAAKGISASTKIILLVPEKATLGDGVAVVGAIVDLPAAGFEVAGVAAGSPAAAVHSVINPVAKGSIFALFQSLGATGSELAVIL